MTELELAQERLANSRAQLAQWMKEDTKIGVKDTSRNSLVSTLTNHLVAPLVERHPIAVLGTAAAAGAVLVLQRAHSPIQNW